MNIDLTPYHPTHQKICIWRPSKIIHKSERALMDSNNYEDELIIDILDETFILSTLEQLRLRRVLLNRDAAASTGFTLNMNVIPFSLEVEPECEVLRTLVFKYVKAEDSFTISLIDEHEKTTFAIMITGELTDPTLDVLDKMTALDVIWK